MNPSPRLMQKIWLSILWACAVLWVIATVTGLVNSPAFISHISLFALILTAGAGVVGESIRLQQREENVSDEVVDELVEKTDVEAR